VAVRRIKKRRGDPSARPSVRPSVCPGRPAGIRRLLLRVASLRNEILITIRAAVVGVISGAVLSRAHERDCVSRARACALRLLHSARSRVSEMPQSDAPADLAKDPFFRDLGKSKISRGEARNAIVVNWHTSASSITFAFQRSKVILQPG